MTNEPIVRVVDFNAKYIALDARVDVAEGDGIKARWEFGRELLRERIGKQLPKGRLADVAASIGKSKQEIGHRMLFAERFPDEAEVSNAIRNFGSWYSIVNASQGKAPHVAQNSGDNEWYTPAQFIEAARLTMGGIDLDPASSEIANKEVVATTIYTARDDGLAHAWSGRVWMNPPYAKDLLPQFAAKLAGEYANGNVTQACVLVNNGTETVWFQELAAQASAFCFPRGRVKFWHPEKESYTWRNMAHTPLQGQAVIYLGADTNRFLEHHADFGFVVKV